MGGREYSEKIRAENKEEETLNVEGQIKEIRCTCKQCGMVWHYLPQERAEQTGAKLHNFGKNMMTASLCCGNPLGCFGAIIPEKKVIDLERCPECKSKDVKKETVHH